MSQELDKTGLLVGQVAFGGNDSRGPIDVAPAISAHPNGGSRYDFESELFLVQSVAENDRGELRLSDVAGAVACKGGKPGQGYQAIVSVTGDVVHALKGEGADASEDGTGRGNPIIAFSASDDECDAAGDISPTLRSRGSVLSNQTGTGQVGVAYAVAVTASRENLSSGPNGRGWREDVAFGLEAQTTPQAVAYAEPIAFSSKDNGRDAQVDLAPTMRAMPHDQSHPNSGGNLAIAYSIASDNGAPYEALPTDISRSILARHPRTGDQGGDVIVEAISVALRGREDASQIELGDDVAFALRSAEGGGSRALALIIEWAEAIKARVRRLTPLECERLQALPDNHTRIPWRGRHVLMCPDGPRYKTIGNGLALTDVRWICARLQRFHALKLRELGRAA